MAIIRSSPLLLLLLAVTPAAKAYSVLTHEAIIDASWEHELKPLLLARFPGSTEDQLRDAHAHAYGGAIIQDMGYYPFGSHFFSDLTHYVRSGDFIVALIRDSQDLNEYAFALGALAHYAADNEGHPVAVNRAEPLIYPKIAKKFGHVVTYEDDPKTHLKTEFGFGRGAGCPRQVRLANLSRLHRVPGVERSAGTSLRGHVFAPSAQRPVPQYRSGARNLPLRSRPAHPRNDQNCLVGQEEGHRKTSGRHEPA